MANIRVDVNFSIKDGSEIVFRSPVNCSAITGLIVYYPAGGGNKISKKFAFSDAHGNNVGNIDHLFAANVVVKVILDVTSSMAFVQNADTNAYLEGKFAGLLSNEDLAAAVNEALQQAKNSGEFDGKTPSFTIGTVTTLSAGSKATASITGTTANPVLNLGIPKGADGSGGSGSTGEDGGYYVPAVNSSGVLSWTASKAGMPSVQSSSIKGADGKTPVRGTDYWTSSDIAEIKSYVDDAILGGAW